MGKTCFLIGHCGWRLYGLGIYAEKSAQKASFHHECGWNGTEWIKPTGPLWIADKMSSMVGILFGKLDCCICKQFAVY